MNRDFEKEYTELAQNEIPDLWDRIEAGLTEKSAPEKKVIYWKRYAGLAAAVLCAAAVIPAFLLTRTLNQQAAYDSAAPEEAFEMTEEACDEAEEAFETTEEKVSGGAGAGYVEMADAASESAFDAAAADAEAKEDGMSDDSAGSRAEKYAFAQAENSSGAMADLEESLEKNPEEKAKVQILSHVTIQITGKEDYGEGRQLYMAVILKDPSGTFSEDEPIAIYVPDDLSMLVTVGKELEVDLIWREGDEYSFAIGQIYVE